MSLLVDFEVEDEAPQEPVNNLISREQAADIIARHNSGEEVTTEEKTAMFFYVQDIIKGVAGKREQQLMDRGVIGEPEPAEVKEQPYPYWRPE